jgi:hypothetical protein
MARDLKRVGLMMIAHAAVIPTLTPACSDDPSSSHDAGTQDAAADAARSIRICEWNEVTEAFDQNCRLETPDGGSPVCGQ